MVDRQISIFLTRLPTLITIDYQLLIESHTHRHTLPINKPIMLSFYDKNKSIINKKDMKIHYFSTYRLSILMRELDK